MSFAAFRRALIEMHQQRELLDDYELMRLQSLAWAVSTQLKREIEERDARSVDQVLQGETA